MRHAAPARRQPCSRPAQLALAVIAYTIAALAAGLATLTGCLAVWGLWQWMGVS